MIVDGKAIADELLARVHDEVATLGRPLVMRAITVAPSAATRSYLSIKARAAEKAGMRLEVLELPASATTEECIEALQGEGVDALIVQLPLPHGVSTEQVLAVIPEEKDADVLAHREHSVLLPPVVGAVAEILARTEVSVAGEPAVVIGNGWLVGQPVAAWLRASGAEVTVLTRESEGMSEALREADIIVSGAGVPKLITPKDLKEGVVLIDAGTSESDGAIVGDADPECASVASVFTPVPGGVGPVAVACLFRNAAALALRQGREGV